MRAFRNSQATIPHTIKTVAVALLVGAAVIPAGAQAQAYRAPRVAGGKPDLNGIWQALNEANYDIETHEARPALALRPGPYGAVPAAPLLALGAVGAVPPGLGVVEGGVLPYKPEALAKKKQNQENWLTSDPEIKCYLPGVPRATYMPYPFQILESASAITFVYEYAGAVRNVFLKDPGPAPVDSWMGQSVGHWEGDVISYEATIEDPQVFTHSWKLTMPLYRRQEKNAQLLDFKCVEFVEELLYGQWRKKPLSRQ